MARKILICDSDEGVRENLKRILSDDYNLILTEDGNQGLDCLAHAKDIGLVLLDIKISENRDLNMLQTTSEKYPRLNILLITDRKSVQTTTRAAQEGTAGYIIKPFKADEIKSTVHKAWQR